MLAKLNIGQKFIIAAYSIAVFIMCILFTPHTILRLNSGVYTPISYEYHPIWHDGYNREVITTKTHMEGNTKYFGGTTEIITVNKIDYAKLTIQIFAITAFCFAMVVILHTKTEKNKAPF